MHSPKTPLGLDEAILLLKDKGEVAMFLKDLCTPQELATLSERWRVCQILADGQLSYREIHAVTGASITTVVRVARFLKDEPYKGYRVLLDRIKDKQI